jgi:hypothetical protein
MVRALVKLPGRLPSLGMAQLFLCMWVGPEVPGHAQHGLLGCGRAMGRMGPVFGAVCVSVQSFSLGVCT